MKSHKVLLALMLPAMLVACGESPKGSTPAGRSGPPGKATDDIPTSAAKGMYVDHFRFGNFADADGIVVGETNLIPPGSTAVVSLYVRNIPAGTQVRLVWGDAGKAAIDEEVKPVGDKGLVTFKQAKPLPEGNYHVDMYYKEPGGKKWENLGAHEFSVGGKK